MLSYFGTSSRVETQLKALRIYYRDYAGDVDTLMQYVYPDSVYARYRRHIRPRRNPLRKCAEYQSTMYQRPPRLSTDNEEIANTVIEKCPELYVALDELQRMTYGIGDVFAWPYWSAKDEEVKIQIIPPHNVDVELDRCSVRSMSFLMDGGYKRTFGADPYTGRPGVVALDQDASGEIIQAKPTGGDVFPIVWFHLTPVNSGNVWSYCEVQDLVDGTLNIGLMEALHSFTTYLRSYRQPKVNASEYMESVTGDAGENPIATLETGPDILSMIDIDTVALADPADQFLDAIRREEEDLAASRGISVKTYRRDVVKAEEYSTISEELRQRWRRQIKIFEPMERELLRVVLWLINKYTGTDYDIDTKFKIDYFAPEEMDDESADLDTLKKGIELGVRNRIDYLFKTHPEFDTREEAAEYGDLCDEERMKWAEQNRAMNIPKDATDPGQDPEVNGALGPETLPTAATPSAMEYQQQANDARSNVNTGGNDNE